MNWTFSFLKVTLFRLDFFVITFKNELSNVWFPIWRHFKKNKSRHRNCAINDYFPLWDFDKKNLIPLPIHLCTSLIQVASPHITRFLSFMKSRLKWSLCKVHFTLIFFLCKVWTLIIKRLHFWELCKVKPCKVKAVCGVLSNYSVERFFDDCSISKCHTLSIPFKENDEWKSIIHECLGFST